MGRYAVRRTWTHRFGEPGWLERRDWFTLSCTLKSLPHNSSVNLLAGAQRPQVLSNLPSIEGDGSRHLVDHKTRPGDKVPPAGEGLKNGREGHDGACGHRADTRHGSESEESEWNRPVRSGRADLKATLGKVDHQNVNF